MAKAHIHAESSARKFGGEAIEYMKYHVLMDSSKGCIPSHAHRVLTHTSWFISTIIPQIFGHTFTNSAGKVVSIVDVCEQHILEDFGMKFIPTVQDYLQNIPIEDWMVNGKGEPPSAAILYKKKNSKPKPSGD